MEATFRTPVAFSAFLKRRTSGPWERTSPFSGLVKTKSSSPEKRDRRRYALSCASTLLERGTERSRLRDGAAVAHETVSAGGPSMRLRPASRYRWPWASLAPLTLVAGPCLRRGPTGLLGPTRAGFAFAARSRPRLRRCSPRRCRHWSSCRQASQRVRGRQRSWL